MMLWEIYTWDSVRAYHFDFHQAQILEGIDDSVAWETPTTSSNKICWYLAPPETQTLKRIGMLRQATRQRLPPKYVLSGTPKKIVLATADFFTNAPTVQAITPNVVAHLDLPHQVLAMQTQLRSVEDNSNPSTPWNLSLNHSFIL